MTFLPLVALLSFVIQCFRCHRRLGPVHAAVCRLLVRPGRGATGGRHRCCHSLERSSEWRDIPCRHVHLPYRYSHLPYGYGHPKAIFHIDTDSSHIILSVACSSLTTAWERRRASHRGRNASGVLECRYRWRVFKCHKIAQSRPRVELLS
jgi:hypothetical protein